MSDNRLPTEVELAYEVMPCNAMRSAQEPGESFAHPCAYFRRWGRYHSYDYREDGPPPTKGIVHLAQYVGRAALVPELLSGCRKAPIMAVGINPNLPGWSRSSRHAVHPLFDDYKQYAHYFRYRTTAKLQIPRAEYAEYRGDQDDSPLRGDFELVVPANEQGVRAIPVELQTVTMYANYQSLLKDMADAVGWADHKLSIGEDVSYGNMVACPSARWINRPSPDDPAMPPMTPPQQRGIVAECFRERQYFLRQLFQSLPAVLMVFSQSTTDAFLGEMRGRFSKGDPQPGERITDLLEREVRLRYGTLPDGTPLDGRVIFSPHITGDPEHFKPMRERVLAQLVAEARAGRLQLNPDTGHLRRPAGSCVFCTAMEVGPCDYLAELRALAAGGTGGPGFLAAVDATGAAGAALDLLADKRQQNRLLAEFLAVGRPARNGDGDRPAALGPQLASGLDGGSDGLDEAAADLGWDLSGDPRRQREAGAPDKADPSDTP